ncbi:tetratricopeptide repeat protein, partial [bacterium]|nr:tetratricopeptide repeat protein [bacterium]
SPNHLETYEKLASALLQNGEIQEANECFEKAFSLEPTEAIQEFDPSI